MKPKTIQSPKFSSSLRRLSFGRAFRLYPLIVMDVAKTAISISPDSNPDIARPSNVMDFPHIITVLAMQFAIRILRTREKMEIETSDALPVKLIDFVQDRIEYYQRYLDAAFPEHKLVGDKKRMAAFNHVEQGMSGLCFEAFIADAQTDDFNEGQFWRDFFRGIADNDKSNQLIAGFERLWLDAMPQYLEAVKVDDVASIN
jgi:hypothetical protein